MRRRFYIVLIAYLTFSSHANAQVLRERPLSAPNAGPAPNQQYLPSAASDGQNYFVAWQDLRQGLDSEIYGARVSAAGELLDPTGIRLSTDGRQPVVIFAGGAYAVFWLAESRLEVLRLSVDGQIIDSPRRVTDDLFLSMPAIASNRRTIVLASRDHLLLLDDHAALRERVSLPVDPSPDWTPTIATNGSTFLLAWGQSFTDFTTMVMPLDATGHPSAPPRPAGPFQFNPKIGSDGRDFLMAVPGPNNMAMMVPVSAAGQPAAAGSLSAPTPELEGVAWNGAEYLVLFKGGAADTQTLEALRVDHNGTAISNASIVIVQASGFGKAVVVSAAGRTGVFAEEAIGNDDDIRGHLIEGTSVASLLVSQAASEQAAPLIASWGNGVIVTWSDHNLPYANLYTVDGTPRLADPIGLPLTPRAVVFDGANYVLFGELHFGSGSGTYAIRIAPDTGALLDPTPVRIHDEEVSAAAKDSAGTVIATTTFYGVRLTHIDRSLAIGKSAQVAWLEPARAGDAALAWNGAEWLVAFARITYSLLPEFPDSEVVAVRASADLDPLDTAPIELGASLFSSRPTVASNGKEFAVFWSDGNAKARRVSGDGNALGEVVTISRAELSDALWDGAHYAVAVERDQTCVTHLTSDLAPLGDALFLAPAALGRSPRLAQTPAGLIAAYARRAFEPVYGGVFRAFLRTPVWTRTRPVGR